MSQAEELLDSLSEDEIAAYTANSSDEPHIVVNADRTITVPDELKNIAVQFDHNIETVTFDCPRYWDEHDLSTMQVFINYMTPNKQTAQYSCTDVTVDENDETMMHFSWVISSNVTEVEGIISFLICVKDTDDAGYLSNRWSSRLNQEMSILKGMNASNEIVNKNVDIITSMLERLDVLENYPAYHRIHVMSASDSSGLGSDFDSYEPGDIILLITT